MSLNFLLQINTVTDTVVKSVPQQIVTAPKVDELTLLTLIMKGGPIMIPIFLLLIIGIYVFIERYITIKKALRVESNFMNNIRDFIHEGKIDAARALCKGSTSSISKMIEKGISRIGRPLKEIEEAIENVGKFEIYQLEKNLAILSIVAGIAPMFGFIGTIIGVIKIFYDISLSSDVSIGTVSAGLYTKMVSSAAGLMVGILAFVCYHWLNIMLDKMIHRLEKNAIEFIDLLQEPTK
ncbi:MAG: MotA/TolQ/ExbB proton channel family protein [Bacteroidales bacterium]|nr:MotA/TolQ/ExbB proton channel family protein [Bacteroidales bacterium]